MPSESTLTRKAYHFLREEIILGRIEAGARLTEHALSERTGISRGPIREALRQLDSEGIVRHVAHQGATVHVPSVREFEELADLRTALESMIAARAAERITSRQVSILRETVEDLRDAARRIRKRKLLLMDEPMVVRVTRADLRFHGTLMSAADSPRAAKMVRNLRVLSHVWSMRRADAVRGAMAQMVVTLREHYRICAAVARRDTAAARAAMHVHLENSKNFFLSNLENPQSEPSVRPFGTYPAVRQLLVEFENEDAPLGGGGLSGDSGITGGHP